MNIMLFFGYDFSVLAEYFAKMSTMGIVFLGILCVIILGCLFSEGYLSVFVFIVAVLIFLDSLCFAFSSNPNNLKSFFCLLSSIGLMRLCKFIDKHEF